MRRAGRRRLPTAGRGARQANIAPPPFQQCTCSHCDLPHSTPAGLLGPAAPASFHWEQQSQSVRLAHGLWGRALLQAGPGLGLPGAQVVICHNHLSSQEEVAHALTHELVHAYDHCRGRDLDWTNCEHHACSEVPPTSCRVWGGPQYLRIGYLQSLVTLRLAVLFLTAHN